MSAPANDQLRKRQKCHPFLAVANLHVATKRSTSRAHKKYLAEWESVDSNNCGTISADLGFYIPSIGELYLALALRDELLKRDSQLTFGWIIKDPELIKRVQPLGEWVAVGLDVAATTSELVSRLRVKGVIFFDECKRHFLPPIAREHGIWLALVNARGKATQPTGISKTYYRFFYSQFDMLFPQDDDSASYFTRLGLRPKLGHAGNMKFDLAPGIHSERAEPILTLLPRLKASELLLAGSLFDSVEDTFVLDAFEIVKQQFTSAKLVMAPRRIERSAAVLSLARSRGLTASLRSVFEPDVDVLVLDSLGELSSAYSLAGAAFVGGTITGAGQNVIEPLFHGTPTAFGSCGANVAFIRNQCMAADLGQQVLTPTELAAFFARSLSSSFDRKAFATRASNFLRANSGSTPRLAHSLYERLTRSNVSPVASHLGR